MLYVNNCVFNRLEHIVWNVNVETMDTSNTSYIKMMKKISFVTLESTKQEKICFHCQKGRKKKKLRLPGVEPGSIAWKAIILTVGLQTLLSSIYRLTYLNIMVNAEAVDSYMVIGGYYF